MTGIRREVLFKRLNSLCYGTLEAAVGFCKLRGHPHVELLHWLYQILQRPDSDIQRILQRLGRDVESVNKDLLRALDQLPRGATSISDLSVHLDEAAKEGWFVAELSFESEYIRSGHLLIGAVGNRWLRSALVEASPVFKTFQAEEADACFREVAGVSAEATQSQIAIQSEPNELVNTARSALSRFATDITARARAGLIDPVLGRDDEIRMVIDVLMRRRQNNPILTGDAGVGKTAVVEGLANRIVRGDVPPALRGVAIHSLDLGLLQAGAGARGEFEERLRQVVGEAQAAQQKTILFIDEAHALIGAGGREGTGDAANLLKPALARGTLRTIGATTWAEYKQHIEKDAALTRRFQPIAINEPNEAEATTMLRGMVAAFERHHDVEIADEAIIAAVALSRRYITDRQLPDKAISLLDTSCSRVAVSLHSPPAQVSRLQQTILASELELLAIERQAVDDEQAGERAAALRQEILANRRQADLLHEKWQAEVKLVEKLRVTRASTNSDRVEPGNDRTEIRALEKELHRLAGDAPLVRERVTRDVVAAVVAEWTGISISQLLKDDPAELLDLAPALNSRIIGQTHAVEAIANKVLTSRAGLEDPRKPVGVFLLCGPSGVGKTETAHALSDILFGGPSGLITINMNEFQEAHNASSLKGAPPGYVGYGKGGRLTEAVRRKPNSIVLLDEIEKAHSDIHELFYQVFDKGVMEDGEGHTIDFANTLVVMTSNLGAREIMALCRGDRLPNQGQLEQAIRPVLASAFSPAFLGRVTVLPFYPIGSEILSEVMQLQLSRIASRIMQVHGAYFNYSDDVLQLLASKCLDDDSGARGVEAIIAQQILPLVSQRVFASLNSRSGIAAVCLGVQRGEFTVAVETGKDRN
ncbi:type VI secretion system ATPase TssH [Ensifer adhaerens]|uniref:type VI secretion system ATPase TssH n=1 Tax=Ensifer adhaerens TaxID=106592 RepID=UPI00384EF612